MGCSRLTELATAMTEDLSRRTSTHSSEASGELLNQLVLRQKHTLSKMEQKQEKFLRRSITSFTWSS